MTTQNETPIARELRALREERGHSKQRMSDVLGVSATMLHYVEKGTRKAPPGWLDKLQRGYQLTEEETLVLANAFDAMASADAPVRRKKMPKLTPFGVWLRQYRQATRLTMTEMAESLGVSGTMLHMVETGKRNIPDGWLERLQDVYQLDGMLLEGLRTAYTKSNVSGTLSVSGLDVDERQLVKRFADVVASLGASEREAVALWLETLEAGQEVRG